MTSSQSTRKAAILLTCLDEATAGQLLSQMTPEQASLIREAMNLLGPVEQFECDEVIDEFFRSGEPGGDADLPRPVASVALNALTRRQADEDELELSGERPFHFLQETESTELVPFLADEHPQTIAVVVSHMPPERATAVVAGLPAALQADVVRRLIDLDEMHPTILREVERGLESRISVQARRERRQAAGIAAVMRIFQAADARLVNSILANLQVHDRDLAARFSPATKNVPPVRYDELAALDNETLLTIFAEAGPALTVLALTGSSAELVDHVLSVLPSKQVRSIRRELDHPGPTRLSDVEQAQQEVARIAQAVLATRGQAHGMHQRLTFVS